MRIIGNGGHARVIRSFCNEYAVDGCVIAIGDNAIRKREAEKLSGFTGYYAHPRASINLPKSIGVGTVIMAGAVIQPNVTVGKHAIINTGASVDHDCIIGDYVHIAPGCHLCGSVEVGEGAFLGAGTIAIPGVKIAPWSKVRAGSTVTRDVCAS